MSIDKIRPVENNTIQQNQNTRSKYSQKTSNLAITSMVCGILALFTTILTGIPAIIFGLMARSSINKSNGQIIGGGKATTGIVFGLIGSFLFIFIILTSVILPAISESRRTSQKIKNMSNIKNIGQAFEPIDSSNEYWLAGFNGKRFTSNKSITLNGIHPKDPNGSHPSVRLAILLSKGLIDKNALINPAETQNKITIFDEDKAFDATNTSYALLHIGRADENLKLITPAPKRRVGWFYASMPRTPILADRNISSNNEKPLGVFSKDTQYNGHVLFGDNHVEFTKRADLRVTLYGPFLKHASEKDYATQSYGPGKNKSDNLFTNEDNGNDALLIHTLIK